MQFQFTDTYLYWWPVEVQLPDPDKPGKTITQAFTMQFEAIGSEEEDAIIERIKALPPEDQKKEANAVILAASMDWRDVVDGDGKPVPFSEEALRSMLRFSWMRVGIHTAYLKSLAPGEARKGN